MKNNVKPQESRVSCKNISVSVAGKGISKKGNLPFGRKTKHDERNPEKTKGRLMPLPSIEWLCEDEIWEAISSLKEQYENDPICIINFNPIGYIKLEDISYFLRTTYSCWLL